jgi:hypothetical protein
MEFHSTFYLQNILLKKEERNKTKPLIYISNIQLSICVSTLKIISKTNGITMCNCFEHGVQFS